MIIKKLLLVLLLPALSLAQNFKVPDANFEQALINLGIDSTSPTDDIDGQVNLSNAVTGTKKLDLANKNISDLTGIENFTSLKELECENNNISTIDLSQNVNLELLFIYNNNLVELDLNRQFKLVTLWCQFNKLTSLVLPSESVLDRLECGNNNLTELDLTYSKVLTELYCGKNLLTALNVNSCPLLKYLEPGESPIESVTLDLCPALERINFRDCNLSSLDLSNNPNLKRVNLQSNDFLKVLYLKNGNLSSITSLNVTFCPNLTCIEVDDPVAADNQYFTYSIDSHISFSTSCPLESEIVSIPDSNFEQALIDQNIDSDGVVNGQVLASDIENITYLDVNSKNISNLKGIEGFIALETLFAHNNNLSSVDVSANEQLSSLVLAINKLSSIDVSNNINLVSLSLNDNAISSLDLSENTSLVQVYADENQLTALDVSKLILLEELTVTTNNISELILNENKHLRILNCSVNQIRILNVLSNFNLETLNCERNSIEYLDLSLNTKLEKIAVNDNDLKGLNLKNGSNTSISNSNFVAFANSELTCIEVDDVNYSNNNWAQIDMQTSYSLNCTSINDNCSYAIPIILGQDTPGNTVNASGSLNNPDCLPSGVVAYDVWYAFPAPDSGRITMTISAGALVGKVALYSSCADSQPLYCATNELVVNGLTPGVTYYLQVWLELSTTPKSNSSSKSFNESGTFVLNVQDSNVLSLVDVQDSQTNFSVYPNPAEDYITVQSSNVINSIEIFTLSGQKLFHKKTTSSNTNRIYVSDLNIGFYLLKININSKSYTEKLVIK